jgi:hypothetical protein
MKTTRCRDCLAEFTDEEIKGAKCCPSCHTTRIPVLISEDILLPINWAELRTLTIWATRWADGFPDDDAHNDSKIWLQKLLNRINKLRPPGGGALTLAQEIKELQKEFPTAELIDGNGTTIIPPKEGDDQ